ncbi:acetyl-CoA carboxylase biotin carboxyl carrier protein [Candidatus Soleaferrea massiliensis]|uniref:acetyl-CoA carboxylase biotin carboxyl carrier protein n=1 Tax=Candidatus Soleaferrea massiliensis TaxID=1470354 RepID=UPI00058BC88C|nr:acetyl-CoA carboxylase biotin carboxyl carrier protein [Candidatus Soleaferrea massiliensis]
MYSVEEIMTLMDKLAQTELDSVQIKDQDMSLTIKAKRPRVVEIGAVQTVAAAPCEPAAETQPKQEKEESGKPVKSPIVGTFYEAPSPDKPPFVKVGQQVRKGDVLFIIESMKLMNEVISEADGVISKICVENNSPVEYGQVIMYME